MTGKLSKQVALFSFSLALMLLFSLWFSVPWLLRRALPALLPDNWSLVDADIARPALASLEIRQLRVRDNSGNDILVKGLTLPYRYASQTWVISELALHLAHGKEQSNPSSDITIPAPFAIPISVQADNCSIIAAGVQAQGRLKVASSAITFDGQLDWQQQQLPVQLRLTGLDSAEKLVFAIKVNAQQLQANYLRTSNPHRIQLTMHADQTLVALLQLTSFWPQDSFNLTTANIDATATLNLPEQTNSVDSWLNAVNEADVALKLGDAEYIPQGITLKANSWQLHWQQHELSIKALQPGEISTGFQGAEVNARLYNDKALRFRWQKAQLDLQQSPALELNWQQQSIKLQPNTLSWLPEHSTLTSKLSLQAGLTPNSLPALALPYDIGQFTLASELALHLDASALRASFSDNNLTSNDTISLPDAIAMHQLQLAIQPFSLELEREHQPQTQQLLKQLALHGDASFNLDIAQDLLLSQCDWQFQGAGQQLALHCNTRSSAGQATEQINTTINSDFNKPILFSLNADALTLSHWPVTLLPQIGNLHGQASIRLTGTLALTDEFSPQQLLAGIAPGSSISISQLSASLFKLPLNNATLHYQRLPQQGHHVTLTAETLGDPAKLTLAQLTGELDISENFEHNSLHSAFNLFGGHHQLNIDELKLNGTQQQAQLSIERLDIDELTHWLAVNGLQATGHLSGNIPFSFDENALHIANAQLQATEPGRIQYLPPGDNTPFADKNIAFQALENFQYQQLTLNGGIADLPLDAEGSYRLPMRIVGHNPKLYAGKSIAINPVISGKIPEKALYYLIHNDIFSKGLIKQKSRAAH